MLDGDRVVGHPGRDCGYVDSVRDPERDDDGLEDLLLDWLEARAGRLKHYRAAVVALRKWLRLYSHHRTHTAIGGVAPASRVTYLSGQYS